MARTKQVVNEKTLSKGELRKLNALRKSLGEEIADEAFSKWYGKQQEGGHAVSDPNVELMESALNPLVAKLKFPRGQHYTVRRGRGRVIIEPVSN